MKSFKVSVLAACLFPGVVFADDCTEVIETYVIGMESVSTIPGATDAARKEALNTIDRIATLRKNNTDCEVRKQIPALQNSHQSVEHAAEVARQFKAKRAEQNPKGQ